MHLSQNIAPSTPQKTHALKLATLAKWLVVPAVFLFCMLLPLDTFVPKVRSTRRSPSPILTQEQTQVLRNETAQLIESLNKRTFQNPVDERGEGKLQPSPNVNEIEKIEAFVGTRLPEDFRFFLERYDGLEQARSYRGLHWLKRSEILNRGKDNLSIHIEYASAPQRIPGAWYHPVFVPFEDLDSSGLGVDAFTGVVYHWDHDGGQLKKVANSFRDLLYRLDSQMAEGQAPDWTKLIR
jgi:cell wall assembly regulator SMI1